MIAEGHLFVNTSNLIVIVAEGDLACIHFCNAAADLATLCVCIGPDILSPALARQRDVWHILSIVANRLSMSALSSMPLSRNCCTYFALNNLLSAYRKQKFIAA